MTWIKICGTTNLEDAHLSVAAGADALGFIFTESPRRVEIPLAKEIVASLPGGIEAIGVFVNESPARVLEIATEVGLSGVQLHGDEPAESLPEFRGALGARKIIKTLQARELLDGGRGKLEGYLSSRDSFDAVLLDSGSPVQRGGTGATFDWEQAASIASLIRQAVPLIVAGGLTSDNVVRAVQLFQPAGVDVVSGVERERGRKDETKLRDFVDAVRRAS